MLVINNLHANLTDSQTPILHGVNLKIQPGHVHVIQGRNGSGKSTLAAVISGDPKYTVTGGSIKIEQQTYPDYLLEKAKLTKEDLQNIQDLQPNQRSLLGIFLANQYPLEIPGVNLSNFLRLAYNARQQTDLPVFKFRKLLKQTAQLISYPEHLLDRNLNEGFSGGEKKKTEILQLALLQPHYAILDETDSGLDKQAIKEVFMGLNNLKQSLPDLSIIVITHYDKVFDYLKPDFVHTMQGGVLTSE